MIRCFCTFFVISFFSSLTAQRDFTPRGRKGTYFGRADYKDYRFYGMQFSIGPTYLLTRIKNPSFNFINNGRPATYTIDPSGRAGFFMEVGMAHFTQRRSKLAKAWKKVFISYFDYGLGFKLLNGSEKMKLSMDNLAGMPVSASASGDFKNGYVYGRFSIHKNHYIGKKYFLDNGLGLSMDYRILETSNSYGLKEYGLVSNNTHHRLVSQLQYELGFGIKLSRRSFLIPCIQVPVLGFYEWRGGATALKWFDSNYVPLLAKVKLIYLFEKKVKGCNTPGSEDDRKRNEEFLQNN
jgi:hypothetical protein